MSIAETATIKRLVLAKRLLLEAARGAHRNYSERLMAAVQLGLAIEVAMKSIVQEVEAQPVQVSGTRGYMSGAPSEGEVKNFKVDQPHRFYQLYNQVVAILRASGHLEEDESLYRIPSVERISTLRNSAQHDAIAPSKDDLAEMAAITRDFIDRLLSLGFFNCCDSLAGVSLSILLDDQVLKQYVGIAEKELASGSFRACALFIYVAFLLGRLKRRFDFWRDRQGHRMIDDFNRGRAIRSLWYGPRGAIGAGNDRMTDLMTNIVNEVSRLPNWYDNYVLGLEYQDRRRLHAVAPRLTHPPDIGQPALDEAVVLNIPQWLSETGNWKGPYYTSGPTRLECLWACDYITETLVRWQTEEEEQHAPVAEVYLEIISKLRSMVDEEQE